MPAKTLKKSTVSICEVNVCVERLFAWQGGKVSLAQWSTFRTLSNISNGAFCENNG